MDAERLEEIREQAERRPRREYGQTEAFVDVLLAEVERLRGVVARVQWHVENCRWCHGKNHDWDPDPDPTHITAHPLLGHCIVPADRPCPRCADDRAALADLEAKP